MNWFKKKGGGEGEGSTTPSPSSTDPDPFAVLEMEKAGDIDGLLRAVGHPTTPDDAARVDSAALALAKLKDPRAREPLLALLKLTPAPITRRAIIEALGDIGDERAVPPMLEGYEPMINVLRAMIAWVREYARAGDAGAVPALDGVASASASAGLVAGQAKKMLDLILTDHVTSDLGGLLGDTLSLGPNVGDLLSAAVQAGHLATTTAEALGKLADARAAAALRSVVEDESLREAADTPDGLLAVDPGSREGYLAALRQMAARPGEKEWMAVAFDPAKYVDSLLPQMAAQLRETAANALRLIGTAEPQRTEAPSESTIESSIEGLIRQHLARLGSQRGLRGVQDLCDGLLAQDLLSLAVSSVVQRVPEALAGGTPSSSTNLTTEWLVAVTVCPALRPDDVRRLFPGGYLALLDELAKPGLTQPERRHVAHWIYCTDGDLEAAVHLTLIPNPKASGISAILATDLMTQAERQQVGM